MINVPTTSFSKNISYTFIRNAFPFSLSHDEKKQCLYRGKCETFCWKSRLVKDGRSIIWFWKCSELTFNCEEMLQVLNCEGTFISFVLIDISLSFRFFYSFLSSCSSLYLNTQGGLLALPRYWFDLPIACENAPNSQKCGNGGFPREALRFCNAV